METKYTIILVDGRAVEISIGNHMNAVAIRDLHYVWYLKILWKLYEPSGQSNLKNFQISRVVVILIARAFIRLFFYYITEKIGKARALIWTAVQIKKHDKQACS